MAELQFIKNVVSVNVDGLRGVNHYTIKAAYDEIIEDERGKYASYTEKVIDEFDMTWDEIEEEGGIAKVNADIEECYGVEMAA